MRIETEEMGRDAAMRERKEERDGERKEERDGERKRERDGEKKWNRPDLIFIGVIVRLVRAERKRGVNAITVMGRCAC